MSAKFYNGLKYFCLEVNESPEAAEEMEQLFRSKFNDLGKYDQMEISLLVETSGWQDAFISMGIFE